MSTVYYLVLVVLIALAVTFIIQFAEKRGYRDHVIDNTEGLLQEMLKCDFCLGFWTSLILSIIVFAVLGNWWILFVPVFTTPIIRFLLN